MEQADLLDLRDYLQVLRQQAPLVAVIAVTVTVVAVVAALLQTPQYEARAELILERVGTTQDISLNELLNPVGIVGDAEVATAESLAVAERAAAVLGRDDVTALRSQVTVSVVDDTQRLRFRAVSTDPEAAARTADAFATAFVEHRRAEAVASIERLRTELDERSLQLREQIDAVDRELDALGPEPDDADDTTTTGGDRETLSLRRQALQSQLSQTILRSTQLDGTADADALTGFDTAFIPATVPTDPVGGGVARTAVLAIVLGLMLGVGAAFLRDHIDDGLQTEQDLVRATDGLPVLGRIPVWGPTDGPAATRLVGMVEPTSHAAEAYRELSANVRFLLVASAEEAPDGATAAGGGRAILVGSANIGEGKTATAANLAIATARVGLRTILVDADLRRSAIARRFGIPGGLGLSDVLLGGEHPDGFFDDVGVPNLRLLTAGTSPPNPAELLASPAMRSLHATLLQDADLVIYDTPAVLAVADALEIGPLADLGIIVGRVGVTTRRRLHAAVSRLRQVGTEVSGAVLNGLGAQHDGYRDEYQAYSADDRRDPWSDGHRDDELAAVGTRPGSGDAVVPAEHRPRHRRTARSDESLFSDRFGADDGA